MSEELKTSPEQELRRLIDIVSTLRSPEGCPWDIEQTPESMIPFLLEEAYEVVESIEDGNQEDILAELGDLLLHIVMQAQMAEENNNFELRDSIRSITVKQNAWKMPRKNGKKRRKPKGGKVGLMGCRKIFQD
jgi:uncharacterized protein YabN with tetrapyrrole methylase and pyrophosphatase domain